MSKHLLKAAVALRCIVCILSFASLSFAQEATVVRNVNLRSDPSAANPPIRLLTPPETVTLMEPNKTNGYYHVTTQDGTAGWVWSRNIQLTSGPGPTPTPTPIPVATGISPDWLKPDPVTGDFQAADGTCGPSGNGGDSATNLRKNRTDVPDSYHEVPFDAVASLPYPHPAPTNRQQWTNQQLDAIKPYEGVAISVVGYIAALKPEGKESTNCGWTKASEVDWHIPVVRQPGQGEPDAVVTETTPRIRASHPKWMIPTLTSSKDNQTQVRISGWLMLDPVHVNHLGRFRTTLWEIHPITKIEVWVNNQWVDIDK
jgi:Bacterial SH3 domain